MSQSAAYKPRGLNIEFIFPFADLIKVLLSTFCLKELDIDL